MTFSKSYVGAVGVAVPPRVLTQQEAEEFLKKQYAGKLSDRSMSMIRKLFSHPSVRQRYFAFDNPEVLINEDPDDRIERFRHWSVKLSAEAVTDALKKAGLKTSDISALVVNTCTGYLCPGISTYVLDALKLNRATKVYDLAGSGCGGAIPNIELCRGLLRESDDSIVVSVSVEICSCTYQIEDNMSLIVSNALFGDGAAAAVLWNRPKGLEIVSSYSLHIPENREDIRFIYKHGQLHNQLSLRLPSLVGPAAAQLVNELLTGNNLRVEDIRYWALHSGGDKVINAVKENIGLNEEQVAYTRSVLAQYGNMSSPTVWFVLREIQKSGMKPGEWALMLAFGAGFSAHAMLLRS
jgi:predicted naringenin-chalcone synthase